MNLHFHSDQRENWLMVKFSQVCTCNNWAGNMLIFHVDVNMKRLGIRFKNDTFKWFRVDSVFWETMTLNTVHFQISNVFIHLELCYTLHERYFSKIHNRGTLIIYISVVLFSVLNVLFSQCSALGALLVSCSVFKVKEETIKLKPFIKTFKYMDNI